VVLWLTSTGGPHIGGGRSSLLVEQRTRRIVNGHDAAHVELRQAVVRLGVRPLAQVQLARQHL